MRIILAAALAVALPAAAGALDGEGNGPVRSEERAVPAFTRIIEVRGALDADVRVGPARRVTVIVDQDLQRRVEVRVEGETLIVDSGDVTWRDFPAGFMPGTRRRVEIDAPALRAVRLSGSGDVAIEGGQGDLRLAIEGAGDLRWRGEAARLEVALHGSGDVALSGRADALGVSVEGSGDVDAANLRARSAEVAVDGSGDVRLRLDGGVLRASVSGSGDVTWSGEARVERATGSGSGSISRR